MKPCAVFHRDPATHLPAVLKALAAGEPVFVGNPEWSPLETAAALGMIPAGTTVLGLTAEASGPPPLHWPEGWQGRVMIPTGGTGGRVKFVIHNQQTLTTAAQQFAAALTLRGLALPLHTVTTTAPWHVSGFLPAIRAAVTGGVHVIVSGSFPRDQILPTVELPPTGTRVVSLVPTQLVRLLEHPQGLAWLKGFDVILTGGATLADELRQQICTQQLPVFVTYGLTELAAACALCTPEALAAPGPVRGQPLPGVEFSVVAGRLAICSAACALGVWPDLDMNVPFVTGDRGEVDAAGTICVLGRADQILISGGIKVDAALVEERLHAVAPQLQVIGVADPTWGQRIIAVVLGEAALEPALRALAKTTLEPAARPKAYVFVQSWPLDARGKLDRRAVEGLLAL